MILQISDCTARRCRFAVLSITIAMFAVQVGFAQISNLATVKSAEARVADFYHPDEVQSVHLHAKKEDLQRMKAALPERVYVRASFKWRDLSIENVAIRFKGNSSDGRSREADRRGAEAGR